MTSHILIVDDDLAVAHGIATLLQQAGYQTLLAYTAAQAHALLAQRPDVVVLDIMLPDQDGWSVCRAIRQHTPYIPILMLTACDDLSDKVRGLELGADEYVTKPFQPRELLARIRAMLRFAEQCCAAQPSGEHVLRCGLLTLWPQQHRAEIQGQAVVLTPKEWMLLELLVQHPGQVFGRETLLRRVWGVDFLGESRVVDVHMQRLRTKLELHGAAHWLETVRGFGYRLKFEHDLARAR